MSLESKSVSEVMAAHPARIKLGQDVTEVAEILLRLRTTGLPVVDADGKVVGFVSEQDCLRSLLVSGYHGEGSPKVENVMNTEAYTVESSSSLVDVANMMLMQKPKIYPVVDERGHLVGLLTRAHVLSELKGSRQHSEVG